MMQTHNGRVAGLSMAAVILVTSTSANAGEARTHDSFFLRLSAGAGSARSTIDVPPGALDPAQTETAEFKLSGASGDYNMAIGGMPAPNLAVHATLWGWVISNPDTELDGQKLGATSDFTISMSGVGVGITYYVMPINLYISPSVGIAIGSFEQGGTSENTDAGFAFDATVGKEWWVSDGWGIGVAGAASWFSVPDGDLKENWTGASFAVRFTATYN